jgi:hypothetical protein
VPPTVTRRELRTIPSPEELSRVDPDGEFSSYDGFTILPMPGGCLVSFGPKGRRR